MRRDQRDEIKAILFGALVSLTLMALFVIIAWIQIKLS